MSIRRITDWRSTETGHRVWPGPLIGSLVIGLLAGLFSVSPAGQALEQRFGLWTLYRLRGPVQPPPDVVIIGMRRDTGERISVRRDPLTDDPCADLRVDETPPGHRILGDVPERWGRCHHVELLRRLKAAMPKTVVFDVTFRPRDDTPRAEDRALGIAMQELGNVVIAQRLKVQRANDEIGGEDTPVPLSREIAGAALGLAPMPLPSADPERFDEVWTFKEVGWNAPTLPSVALQAYLIDAYPALLTEVQRLSPESAASLPQTVEVLRRGGRLDLHVLHLRSVFRELRTEQGDTASLLDALAPSNAGAAQRTHALAALLRLYTAQNRLYLDCYGPPRTIRTVDMTDVLAAGSLGANPDPFGLRGKAVFVGYSDDGEWELLEKFATSMGSGDLRLSGVEVIATAFANLLDGTYLIPSGPWSRFLIATTAGLAVALLAYAASSTTTAIVVLLGVGGYLAAATLVFSRLHLWMPVFVPLAIATPVSVAYAYGYKLLDYRQDRAALHYILEQFVPHDVVDVLARNVRQLGRIKETLNVACMMTDVQGYTALSARLAPEQVSELLSGYFAAIFRPVADHGGFVSDLKGDSILAIWTDPNAYTEVRERVCIAALELRDAVDRFNRDHPESPLPTRIGIHYGPATLGPVGAPGHYEYRAVGDTVNTSSRVEQLSKELGTYLLITDAMAEGLDGMLLRDLGEFQLRGRRGSTRIFELIAKKVDASAEQTKLCTEFAAALSAYEAGRVGAARAAFASVLEEFGQDGPSEYYVRLLGQQG